MSIFFESANFSLALNALKMKILFSSKY